MAIEQYEPSIEQEKPEPSDEEIVRGLPARLLERFKVFEDAPKLKSSLVGHTQIFGTPKEGDTNTMPIGGNMPEQSGLDVNTGLKFRLNALNIKTDPLSKDDYDFLETVMHFLTDRFKENWSIEQSALQKIKEGSIQ